MVWGLWVLMSVGTLSSMEEGQATVFSREHVCSLLAELSMAEKNSTKSIALGRTGSEFIQTILSDTPKNLLQKISGDYLVENSINDLPEALKKELVQQFLSSSSCPFGDTKSFFIARKFLCTVPKLILSAPVCFKTAHGIPVFRIQEAPSVYSLYEGTAKKQTLTFSQEPIKIAWDSSGVGCAYLCQDGSYFQSLEKGQGFIKRLLSDTADSLTALAFHPYSKVALLGLDVGAKFIFSDDRELLISEHTAPISIAKFSHTGSMAATGDEKGIVCLWSKEGALQQRFLSPDTAAVTALSFDDLQGDALSRLLVGYKSGCVRIWDIQKNKTIVGPLHHTGAIIQGCLVGPVAITLGSEGIVAVWVAQTGALIRCIDCDPLTTSCIVARSVDYEEKDRGDELTLVSVQEDSRGRVGVLCDRYDFDMIKQYAILAATAHDPVVIIRAAALARAAKKYGEKVIRSQSTLKL